MPVRRAGRDGLGSGGENLLALLAQLALRPDVPVERHGGVACRSVVISLSSMSATVRATAVAAARSPSLLTGTAASRAFAAMLQSWVIAAAADMSSSPLRTFSRWRWRLIARATRLAACPVLHRPPAWLSRWSSLASATVQDLWQKPDGANTTG